ncbi:MAG: serine hydrolase domain-containing protein [Bacteroidales bacterium]|jgi:CubicO group peptidase (beta-lactamase class C family)
MLNKRIFLLAAALFLVCISCTNKEEKAVKQIDNLLTSLWPAQEPGGAFLLMKGDRVVLQKGYGLATMDPDTKVTPETFFCIASVSKQFAATAILRLAEEGALSLDDPVSKFLPHFKADFFNNITLHHLLTHTSGIPDARPRTDSVHVYHSTDVASYSYLDTLSFLNFDPGTAYEYMNPTYQLFYTIIEKASGMPFETYMREALFDPAGMKEAVYFEDGRDIPRMAHGYRKNKDTGAWEEYDYGETTFFASKADGALYTSLEEFMQWEYALRDNLIISKEMTDKAHTSYIATNLPDTGYGYGWFVSQVYGKEKIFHTGDNGGFTLYAGRYPQSDVLMLVFSTKKYEREKTVAELEDILFLGGLL